MTTATRAWPFVAVLEFTRDGEPSAWIDWFRRPRHSRDGGAWVKDPADQRYARFISDQVVCDRDDRLGYMALVDTPTGDVVRDNEWVIRARVVWARDRVAKRTGWWLRLNDTHLRDPTEWWAELTPLVEWQPRRARGRRADFAGSAALVGRDDELAVFATATLFTLPAIPADVTPCRG